MPAKASSDAISKPNTDGQLPVSNVGGDDVDTKTKLNPLPEGWTAHVDPESSCEYYFHATTGQSTWERPKPPSVLPSPPPRPAFVLNQTLPKPSEESAATNQDAPSTSQNMVSTIRGMFHHKEPLGLLWENRAFVDLFLDGWKEHERHTLNKGFLDSAIALLEGAVENACAECEQHLKQIGHEKLASMKVLGHFISALSGFSQSLPIKSQSEQQILEYVHGVTAALRNLTPGCFLAVPGGWVTSADDSFVLLLIVERMGAEEFSLAVCNTGPDGLSYHPLRADAEESCNMLYRMCLVFDHIPEARLADSSFWFMVARMQVTDTFLFL
jgi:hypothetical protein